jgi:hypothetical protein
MSEPDRRADDALVTRFLRGYLELREEVADEVDADLR